MAKRKQVVLRVAFMAFVFHLCDEISGVLAEAGFLVSLLKVCYHLLSRPQLVVDAVETVTVLSYYFGAILVDHRIGELPLGGDVFRVYNLVGHNVARAPCVGHSDEDRIEAIAAWLHDCCFKCSHNRLIFLDETWVKQGKTWCFMGEA